ncbi:hypothetical protein Nepgr_019549 [Nepenthes gracilis]|uniref:Uncharacterized protein n=1 Tax=Nepenthes gracilis TaxID=150966 RepID=A0AAD3SU75_NEPGR|nr:hypothetical protein Nepgr_019549 [Nepenthes gracilis]
MDLGPRGVLWALGDSAIAAPGWRPFLATTPFNGPSSLASSDKLVIDSPYGPRPRGRGGRRCMPHGKQCWDVDEVFVYRPKEKLENGKVKTEAPVEDKR